MKLLRKGSKGALVEKWQHFLIGQGFPLKADGDFGAKTAMATKRWQRRSRLKPDAIVGNRSLTAALGAGFALLDVEKGDGEWPKTPLTLKPYVGNAARARRFGKFEYEHKPTKKNPERIVVKGDWKRKHIVKVEVDSIPGGKGVWMHKDVERSFLSLWEAWRQANLLPLVRSWNGSYVPRFIRGSTKTLSNHAWGTAFDINYRWNKRGTVPAFKGDEGSVRELVKLANKHNFYWGGHFKRRDGMHFEYAKRRPAHLTH